MSYTRLFYHIVFRTKFNIPAIVVAHEKVLYQYIWGLMKQKECILYRIGGMPDHLHLFMELSVKLALSDFVRELKTSTGKWLKNNTLFPSFQGWGRRYAAFTYGPNEKVAVIQYIANQKSHHSQVSLEEELRTLLAEHGCEIDERYFMNDDE
ncbi:MAG: transposase [Lentisphaeria bacterium]|nr:transposase [Lentisphaeria bacterium]